MEDNKAVMKNLRIVFMGTPEFAVATLGALLINGFNVVGVVTVPDKPAGRGRKITKSAVKEYAEENKLPHVMQPLSLKDPEFINQLKSLNADLFVVVAFRMLPEIIWKMPPIGTINLHASLLPDYRGAAPINRAIINGETMTGVTTFFIDEKIDTGSVILKEKVPISQSENAGDLHDRLMKVGARLVIKTLNGLAENKIHAIPQIKDSVPGKLLHPAPKIHPEDCLIDWNKSIIEVHNLIRGLSPYPCAKSWFKNDSSTISFKVFESQPEAEEHSYKPGTIISDGKQYIRISCKDGFISILTLQLEGKKRMRAVEFLRGFRIANFSIQPNEAV